jgi:protein SCO1/2
MFTRLRSLAAVAALVLSASAAGDGDASGASDAAMAAHHDHAGMDMSAADPHAHHHMAMADTSVQVSRKSYALPAVRLLDKDGHEVALDRLLATDRPVAVNFIFTTCTTICPVMTSTMLQLQRDVAGQEDHPLFVSISIDPDYDTATVMQDYAKRFGAEWTFLTGDHDRVMATLKNFDAWRGNKMNHEAVTLLRARGQQDWTRVVGLASARQLAEIWSDGAN